MENELITLNRTLAIQNGTVGSTDGNSLINYFVSVAVLAEMAVSNADSAPWLVDERLNKRRNSYELDKHLQNMLLFLNKQNGVAAKCISCGRSGLYKTEVVLDNSVYIHFCRSFDKTAKYNRPYLEMNDDSSKLGFCCLHQSSQNKQNAKRKRFARIADIQSHGFYRASRDRQNNCGSYFGENL